MATFKVVDLQPFMEDELLPRSSFSEGEDDGDLSMLIMTNKEEELTLGTKLFNVVF